MMASNTFFTLLLLIISFIFIQSSVASNSNQNDLPDNSTLNQIRKAWSRNNTELVNMASTMNSDKTMSTHNVELGRYTFFEGQPRWRKSELTYAFLPNNIFSYAAKVVFSRAFARWAEVIPMNFTETGNYGFADIRIGVYQGDHGDGSPFDGALGTVAHAFAPESGQLHLDGAENWIIYGSDESLSLKNAVDLESAMVHEIGHVLGMGHSSNKKAIMYPYLSHRKVELTSDDIVGIQVLYGSNPNYNGTSSFSTSDKKNEMSDGFYSRISSLGIRIWSVIGSLVIILLL